MNWLIDNAGFIYLLLGLVVVGLLAAYRLNRNALVLANVGAVLFVIFLLWLLTVFMVSDRQQIRNNLDTMANAVVAHDATSLFRYVARDFEHAGLKRDELYEGVKRSINQHNVKNIHIWGYEALEVSHANGTAKVRFKATIQVPDGERPFGVVADFRLEDDVWKMRSFQLFNNFTNFENPIDIPVR